MQLPYSVQLTETDFNILKRLTFEIDGYETLLRVFLVKDSDFPLDNARYHMLLDERSKLRTIREELISRLCADPEKPYTGNYRVDPVTRTLCWG